MLRKRTIGEGRKRSEDATHAFRIHDERPHVVLGIGINLEIRHVVADPFLLLLVPPNLSAFRVPWLARWITRSAVVHDTPVRGPRPTPVWIDSESRRILSAAAL